MCSVESNNDLFIALIGVGGTLIGTLLGWVLSSISYKIGKTSIHSTLTTNMEIPAYGTPTQQTEPKIEYIIQCVASNSRQIPVFLNGFHIEMKLNRRSKPINLSVLEANTEVLNVNGLKISIPVSLPRQLIPPRTLHEFSFKVDYDKPDILYSRLTLIAYDERHKKHTFLVHNGFKAKDRPKQP